LKPLSGNAAHSEGPFQVYDESLIANVTDLELPWGLRTWIDGIRIRQPRSASPLVSTLQSKTEPPERQVADDLWID
jgi:hypothetical protein